MVIRFGAVVSYSCITNLTNISSLQKTALALVEPFETQERLHGVGAFDYNGGIALGSWENPWVAWGRWVVLGKCLWIG